MTAERTEGGLWRPANLAEDLAFSADWCSHCLELADAEEWEDEFGETMPPKCSILDRAFWGQSPHQLKWRSGKPICTAFREDPESPARCPLTMEMDI